MRIYEIEVPARQVVATNRFRREFAEIQRGYPDAEKNLRSFIEKRRITDMGTSVGRKDYPLQGSALHGYPHTHIIFGKVIMIYDATPEQLRLITVGSHKIVDRITKSLSDWVLGLKSSDFKPFDIDDSEAADHTINDLEKAELVNLFWEFAADPALRAALIAAVNGTWTDNLRDYMMMLVDQPLTDDQKWQAIIRGFGGATPMIDQIKSVLKNTRRY